jgi:hypothetical protein
VTSPRKIRSNRANARSSTGPKTAKGRGLSARNALRYGLSLPVLSDPTLSQEVSALARQIAGAAATPEIQELAHHIAEAHVASAICGLTSFLARLMIQTMTPGGTGTKS